MNNYPALNRAGFFMLLVGYMKDGQPDLCSGKYKITA